MTASRAGSSHRSVRRFGIGEWYGRPFVDLSTGDRRRLAEIQFLSPSERPNLPCPFLSSDNREVSCWKPGGVCSLMAYVSEAGSNATVERGALITTCPSRFEENGSIYEGIPAVFLA